MARDPEKAIPFDPEELFGAIDSGNTKAVGAMLKPRTELAAPVETDIQAMIRKGLLQPFGPEGYHPTRDIDAHFRESHPSFGYAFDQGLSSEVDR